MHQFALLNIQSHSLFENFLTIKFREPIKLSFFWEPIFLSSGKALLTQPWNRFPCRVLYIVSIVVPREVVEEEFPNQFSHFPFPITNPIRKNPNKINQTIIFTISVIFLLFYFFLKNELASVVLWQCRKINPLPIRSIKFHHKKEQQMFSRKNQFCDVPVHLISFHRNFLSLSFSSPLLQGEYILFTNMCVFL